MTKRKRHDRSDTTLSAVVLRRQLQSLNHNGAAHEGRHGRASQPPRSQSLSETTPVRSTHANSRQYWLEGNQDRLDHTPPALDDHPRSSCSSPESGGSYSSSGDSLPDNSDGSVVADISAEAGPNDTLEHTVQRFSTFTPTPSSVVHDTRESFQVRLAAGESLVILGQFDLHVLAGTVTLLGATLRRDGSIHRVYVSSTHALPHITAVPNEDDPSQMIEMMVVACKSGIRRLHQLSPLVDRIWNEDKPVGPSSTNSLTSETYLVAQLYLSTDDRLRRRLETLDVPHSWDWVICYLTEHAKLAQGSIILVCGRKFSGASTFVRLLLNRILTSTSSPPAAAAHDDRICCELLDLDAAQPEYCPPGLVSLVRLDRPTFGPPFTHPSTSGPCGNRIRRAHTISLASWHADPFHFRACAIDLLGKHRESMDSKPLVVTLPGWTSVTGLEILAQLIRDVCPTDVVYLSKPESSRTTEMLKEARGNASFHTIPSQGRKHRSHASSSLRAIQTLSYFHLARPRNGNLQWHTSSISNQRPWVVGYFGKSVGICGIMIPGDSVPPERLINVLDGNLVAVVVLEEPIDLHHTSHQRNAPPSLGASTANIDRDVPEGDTCHFNPHPETGINEQGVSLPDSTPNGLVVRRTIAEKLPYVYHPQTNAPLDPSKSRCIGLALVRSIDSARHKLHLLTPIPKTEIEDLARHNEQVILVLGNLEPPTWAYTEDMVQKVERSRRLRKEATQDGQEIERLAEHLRIQMPKDVPWVTTDNREGLWRL